MENLILIGFLLFAVKTDVLERKISNKLLLIMIITGFIISILETGIVGIFTFALSFIFGILMLIIPFALKQMGAGDVKLVGVISGYLGIIATLNIVVYFSIIGAIIAMIIIFMKTNFPLISVYFKEKGIPYAVPITLGVIMFASYGRVF